MFYHTPTITNEPVLNYAPNSPERQAVKQAIKELKSKQIDIPMHIGGKKVYTDNKVIIRPPHELSHTLGHYSKGDKKHIQDAIDAALIAKKQWENMARPRCYFSKSCRFTRRTLSSKNECYYHVRAI